VTVGLLSAFAAAVLYGVGTLLQAVGLDRASGQPGATPAARIWAARLYGAGLVLDALGFLASLAALRTLPLFVVESALASSVAVTAVLAVVVLRERLARAELLALVGVGAGLVALAGAAEPGRGRPLGAVGGWVLLGSALVLAALGAVALRPRAGVGAAMLAVVAGLGFGGTGVAARVLVLPHPLSHVLGDPELWALVAYAVLGLVFYGLALSRGSVTSTAAITFTVETVVPAAIGLAWLGDRVRPGAAPLAVVAFVLTLAGCVRLARHA
jgi:drug/metabolite transporter (DMT)-like permease